MLAERGNSYFKKIINYRRIFNDSGVVKFRENGRVEVLLFEVDGQLCGNSLEKWGNSSGGILKFQVNPTHVHGQITCPVLWYTIDRIQRGK